MSEDESTFFNESNGEWFQKVLARKSDQSPETLSDNPWMDSDYERSLDVLPDAIRKDLIYGKWIEAATERWQDEPIRANPKLVIGVDLARPNAERSVMRYSQAQAVRRGQWIETPKTDCEDCDAQSK